MMRQKTHLIKGVSVFCIRQKSKVILVSTYSILPKTHLSSHYTYTASLDLKIVRPQSIFQIFWSLFGSILIPFFLGSIKLFWEGPKILFGKKGPLYWILMVLTFPIYPVFLIMRNSILAHASKTYVVMVSLLTTTNYNVAQFIQIDLGLESHIQITITAILLLLANSDTRTIIGLEVLFQEETLFYLPTKVALGFSIAWSIFSCITSHLKGISKKREHSTTLSLIVMIAFTSISMTAKVMSYVLYFVPCLGLLNCLRHLQGEMYPFSEPYLNPHLFNVTTDTFYYGKAPKRPWHEITRWNYVGFKDAKPPNYTLYTIFTIEQYFCALLGILCLNITLQWITKKLTNPEVFKKKYCLDLFIHAILCSFIPSPMEEWDEEKGDVETHKERKRKVFREMVTSIIVNFGCNVILLSPLIILGNEK